MAEKKVGPDLHAAKASHMSVPVMSELEFHLRKEDIPDHKCKVGDTYAVIIPTRCTSDDGDDYRFKQIGTLRISDYKLPDEGTLFKDLGA